MNRLLLEIYADQSSPGNGDEETPGLYISTQAPGKGAPPDPQMPAGGMVVLRLLEQGCVLKDSASGTPLTVGLGEWLQTSGWRVRVTQAPVAGSSPAMPTGGDGEANWAAPEIRINTYDGDRVKHLRCMLPGDEGSQLVVGRGGPGTDLILEDDHVSRVHMRFFIKDGQRLVEDMGSRWGTRLNGEALTSAKPLKHGDELRLGKSTVQYVCYWDMLPPSGVVNMPDMGKSLSIQPPDGVLAAGVAGQANDSAGDTTAPPADPKASSAAPKPPEANKTKVPEVQPILPKKEKPPEPEAKAAVKPPEKPKAEPAKIPSKPPAGGAGGLFVFGAILLILIVLGAIGYLVYLVFFSK